MDMRAYENVLGDALVPHDPKQLIALRAARMDGDYDDVLQLVLEKRAKHKRWVTITQRTWQAKVSKRPQRGAHHDSHKIRERYVRC